MIKTTNTQTFVANATRKHNNFYTYQKSVFVDSKTKLTITCPIHGDFTQSPNNHLTGFGCTVCGRSKTTDKQKHSTTQFIEKANAIHSNKYDYSKTIYKNTKTKVCIVCPDHGEFWQTPNNHLHVKTPQGCPTCGKLKAATTSTSRKLTNTSFAEKATLLHNNVYSYNNCVYTNYHSKVAITCQIHGDFEQTPAHHLSGTGCPACMKTGFNKDKEALLYYLSVANGAAFKIGITNRTVEERFTASDLASISTVKTYQFDKGYKAQAVEAFILKVFAPMKYTGPKLLSSGNTELFNSNILTHIEDIMCDIPHSNPGDPRCPYNS